jgi:hypothetical protein
MLVTRDTVDMRVHLLNSSKLSCCLDQAVKTTVFL